MKDWKTACKKLFYPPIWVMSLLAVISAVALIFVFSNAMDDTPIAYAAYAFSAYALTAVVLKCIKTLPVLYRGTKQMVYNTKYGGRYMTDAAFRTNILLHVSLAVNLLYAAINALFGILYRSLWFGVLAGYYIILAGMRFLLVRYVNRNAIGENLFSEWRRARLCAAVLTLINLVLSGAVLMIMYQDKGFQYHGMLIYVMAAYTFYITTAAIINLAKYRKYNSPVISTTKIIALAAALVSVLSLETAMFAAFGTDTSPEIKRILIAATGAAISITVLAMSSYMIIRSTREIKKLQKETTANE